MLAVTTLRQRASCAQTAIDHVARVGSEELMVLWVRTHWAIRVAGTLSRRLWSVSFFSILSDDKMGGSYRTLNKKTAITFDFRFHVVWTFIIMCMLWTIMATSVTMFDAAR